MHAILLLVTLAGLDAPTQAVIDAMGEKDCPRLHAMLSPEFQRKVPAAAMASLCNAVGLITEAQRVADADGMMRYRATSRSGRWSLQLAFTDGRVSGLRVQPWQDPVEAKTLSEALSQIAARDHVPGLAALAMRGDKVVEQAQAGVRKLGDPTPVGADDRWHLGSDTKAMTATLAALYVKDGKLAWSSTIGQVLSDWKDVDPRYANVTLEQLLSHRGGLPADVPKPIWAAMWKAKDAAAGRVEAVHAMLRLGPGAEKLGGYAYSNGGYMTAGVMIERVGGAPWEVLIKKRLFDALGMSSCGFGPPASSGKLDAPWAHRDQNGAPTPVAPGPESDNPLGLGPAGIVHCSLADWAKFVREHVRGARGEQSRLGLPVEIFRKLHTPAAGGDYALGWAVASPKWASGPVLTHDGSNTMFYASVAASPKDDRIFLVVANRAATAAVHAVLDYLTRGK